MIIKDLLEKMVEKLSEIADNTGKSNRVLEAMVEKMDQWFKDDVRQHEERLKKIDEREKDPVLNAA